MKKIHKILTLSLLSLSLIACGRNESSTSEEPISQDSTTSSVEPTTTSETTSSITSSETTSSSSSSSVNPYASGWPSDVVDDMLEYLGGQYIPYVKIGKDIASEWIQSTKATEFSYLSITTISDWDNSLVDNAETVYRAAGWTCTKTGSSKLVATNAEMHLTVTLSNVGDSPTINVEYDEPFDVTSVSAYDTDVNDTLNDALGGNAFPFIYLGTKHANIGTTNATNQTITIYGYKWSDQIIDNAKTVLSALDWTMSEDSTTISKRLTAEHTYVDGTYCKVVIDSANATSKRSRMVVTYREPFDASTFTDWSQDVKDAFNTNLDGHILPLIYLGTNLVSTSYASSTHVLTMKGAYWNEQVLSLAKTTLANDKDADGNSYWTVTDGTDTYGNNISAIRKDYSDGCTLKLVLSGSSTVETSNKITLKVTYIDPIADITGKTEWSSDVNTKLETKISEHSTLTILDGHEIPFVNMNTDSETATLTYTSSYRRIDIKGGNWNPHIVFNAKKVFAADGWTVIDKSNSYGDCLYATKEFTHETDDNTVDSEHNCEITVKIDAASNFTTASHLYAYINEGFNTSDYTDWDDDIKTQLTNNFEDINLPVFYMGSKVVFDSFTASTNTLTLRGGHWDDSLFTIVKTALTNDTNNTWSVTDPDMSETTPKLVATCSNEQGVYTLTYYNNKLSSYPYGQPYCTLAFVANFIEPADDFDWSDTIKGYFKTVFGYDADTSTNIIPYIYLGGVAGKETSNTTKPTSSTTSLTLTGKKWNPQVLTIAKKRFAAAGGWTTYDEVSSYSKAVVAVKQNADGSYYRIIIKKNGNSVSSQAAMTIYRDKPVTLSTTTPEWTSEQEIEMKSALNDHTITPFELPTAKTTKAKATTEDNGRYSYYQMYGTSVTGGSGVYVINAGETLANDGYTVEYDYAKGVYGAEITASKKFDDGTMYVGMYMSSLTTYYIYAYFLEDFSQVANYEYDSDIKDEIKDITGIDMPSIYLGMDTPYSNKTTSSTTNEVSYSDGFYKMSGCGMSTTFETDVRAALAADTNNTWTITKSAKYKDESIGDVLLASTTNSTGQQVDAYFYVYKKTPGTTTSYVSYAYTRVEIFVK